MLRISCVEATTLMEKKHARSLSFKEKVKLMLHKNICEACRKYEKFSDLVEKATAKGPRPSEDARLSEESKQRIIKSIKDSK